MKTRSFRADRLDIPAFVQDQASLQSELTLSALPRLHSSLHPDAPTAALTAAIPWQARGELRTPRGAAPEMWLHMHAEALVPLTCQRCLQQLDEQLVLDRWFRFVTDEASAAQLDEETDDDVLVSGHGFDLLELLEDELLLALPLAPWHGVCPNPLKPAALPTEPAAPIEPTPQRPNLFAVLAALKKPGNSA